MNIILLGPPGAGKGTQAKIMAEKLNIPHISTGDIFRDNIAKNTELGKEAKKHMDKGGLVPDNLTNKMIEHRLRQADCRNGFILDGYPRTVNQAKFLKSALSEQGHDIDFVIEIVLEEKEILKRLSNRRSCPQCNTVYHLVFNPPQKQGLCDDCGAELFHRADDKKEIIAKRVAVYNEETSPLVEFYNRENKLFKIDGKDNIEVITEKVLFKVKRKHTQFAAEG